MPWYMWTALFLLVVSLLITAIQVGIAGSGKDSMEAMKSAIGTVTIVNTIIMLVFAACGYFYVVNNEMAERPYIMIMLHVSLLLSLISVSVSTLQNTEV